MSIYTLRIRLNGLTTALKRALSRNHTLTALAWVFVVAALVEWVVLDLSQLGALVLFLFLVITSAYYFSLALSLLVSVLAYLLLNYLVVEPRYSLHVPDPKSWIVLVGFMLTSLRVNSLVHKLKTKSLEAELSSAHHHFARLISESLLQKDTVESALQAVIQVLQAQSGVHCKLIEVPSVQSSTSTHALTDIQVIESRDASGGVVWLMPILRGSQGLRGHLRVSATAERVDYLVRDNLQLACNQLNACITRIESVSQMQQAQLQAREEEVRSHLLASLSHDMRTPLTAIMGAATSLSTQYEQLSNVEIRQLIRSIEAESFHLASSSENVLALVKLRSVVSLPEPLAWQSPIEIIEATVRRYELRQQDKAFLVESPPDPPLFRADAILMSQALANLIDNACAAHRSDEPIVISVQCDSQLDSALIRMSVLDRGSGFPEGFAPQDIQAFKAPSKTLRLGLGLAIVQAIVKLHQGTLHIQARPGGGAQVSMEFRAQHPQVDSHEL